MSKKNTTPIDQMAQQLADNATASANTEVIATDHNTAEAEVQAPDKDFYDKKLIREQYSIQQLLQLILEKEAEFLITEDVDRLKKLRGLLDFLHDECWRKEKEWHREKSDLYYDFYKAYKRGKSEEEKVTIATAIRTK